jgi:hypothetical protein
LGDGGNKRLGKNSTTRRLYGDFVLLACRKEHVWARSPGEKSSVVWCIAVPRYGDMRWRHFRGVRAVYGFSARDPKRKGGIKNEYLAGISAEVVADIL